MDYLVKAGDTLSMIARSHNTTVATLMRLNPQIENADRISPGQSIKLPGQQTQQRQTSKKRIKYIKLKNLIFQRFSEV